MASKAPRRTRPRCSGGAGGDSLSSSRIKGSRIPSSGLGLQRAKCSCSVRGNPRPIRYVSGPAGQVRYITYVGGAVLAVMVDIRIGSPRFGKWEVVRLDGATHGCVYLSKGLGPRLRGPRWRGSSDKPPPSFADCSVYRRSLVSFPSVTRKEIRRCRHPYGAVFEPGRVLFPPGCRIGA
ncbi:dTDP-4-dehydrorhamnose 3,5-epimerase family protein [Streptomyces sp. ME02-8801-2C]|uniref:dTDP-4-dehydrorhamnose 3,5-epimerase family protein n=1 Tax=Streptomyces sp. ME02-8801-2C TaxID=3028680 RepID=UPI0039F68F67